MVGWGGPCEMRRSVPYRFPYRAGPSTMSERKGVEVLSKFSVPT